MTTENTQPKQPARQDKDEPTIEVKPDPKAEAKPEPPPSPKPSAAPPLVGRAEAIIRRNVLWSLGAGAVPIPFADAIAVTGVQMKMLSELSELYGVDFTKDIAQKLVTSLFSSLGGVTIGASIGSSVAKLIPGVGTALGIITIPILAGAFTLATGKVFMMHFESGGTLLNFDPVAMRAYFMREFEKAKATVAEVSEKAKTDNGA
ncbi:DUF697 domain-containing protein [Polyangium sp. y55x31]|uniref:YcjF family protein n=1 Tax=Polyangium sp. y55x31 TaxID=3042688 RepID=UPI0024826989|nr:DUF697 domain-containing protein [Polyangium sp. y55x31]MDI1475040.1 DUF697 domain-containing protein [Polyangium sp. y55x31]